MLDVRQTDRYARWFAGLRDPRIRARILVRIRRLSLGNPGDVKPVGEGVLEMRIPYGPGYRVYLLLSGDMAILLAGGTKRTQQRDIRAALRIARHVKER